MIKIGKELIHYKGVSSSAPYTLQNVKRGYWGTYPTAHQKNDPIYKLQVTVNYGYDGLIPNLALQDKIAEYYADVCRINNIAHYDFDGQEFLFNNGHGYYSTKRFFRRMFERAKKSVSLTSVCPGRRCQKAPGITRACGMLVADVTCMMSIPVNGEVRRVRGKT